MEKIPDLEKLDARWFNRFEAVNFEDYEKLSGSKGARQAEKDNFLNSETSNPKLDYPELETFNISEREAELMSLKEDVLELEKNDAVKKLYRTKINELLATLRMLKATKDGDDRKFSRYADFIYGKPEAVDTNYIVAHVKDLIEANLDSEDEGKKEAAERLQQIFADMEVKADDGVSRDILPEGEAIEGLVSGVDEAVSAFEEALGEIGADDWVIEVDTNKGISKFNVSQEHKTVRIPSNEKLLEREISKKKLKGLIEHEIKTHVARRHNGERSKLQLLGLGLDRYLKAEEGVATYAEQQVTGAEEFSGVYRFLTIALAKGLTGNKLDFRQTFEIMKDYNLIAPARDGKEKTLEWAMKTAYDDCVRIFRGTSCATPGAIYPKDMSYFGNRTIWAMVAKDSDVVQKFTIGKYDPNNNEHVALLTQLGILDEDLEGLEGE